MDFKRYLFNYFMMIAPDSRLFRAKSRLAQYAGAYIGDNVCINGRTRFYETLNVRIGNDTWVGIECLFYASAGAMIDIGSKCDIGPRVSFITGTHENGNSERRAGDGKAFNINVGSGTWIGTNVTLLGGADIGEGCIVAAGSVVVKGIYQDDVLLGGVPAKVIKRLNELS